MRTERETQTINRLLATNGLATLDDPGLVQQIRYLVANVCTTHEQFRQLLNKCDPPQRTAMYETLKSCLRFSPKPLDVYLAESADLAERKQLPTIAADGTLKPFRAAAIGNQLSAEERSAIGKNQKPEAIEIDRETFDAFAAAVANVFLEMTCGWCTRSETFSGWNKDACVTAARAAGWTHSVVTDQEICPRCLPPRN
jgi:hypothetical protein